jgi:hypothetical protein
MNIRNEIEKYISLYAPEGVTKVLEEKSDLAYYLSWPNQTNFQKITITLDSIYERELECETDNVRTETLDKIRSYLEEKFINFKLSPQDEAAVLIWHLKTVLIKHAR